MTQEGHGVEQDTGISSPKRRGGAPVGNLNAAKQSPYLSKGKRGARAVRDAHRRRGQREARCILLAAGLGHDPLGRLVARQLGRLEGMAQRLETWHQHRGYFKAGGELKASVRKEIEVIDRPLGEARKLLEALKARGDSLNEPKRYIAQLAGGRGPALWSKDTGTGLGGRKTGLMLKPAFSVQPRG